MIKVEFPKLALIAVLASAWVTSPHELSAALPLAIQVEQVQVAEQPTQRASLRSRLARLFRVPQRQQGRTIIVLPGNEAVVLPPARHNTIVIFRQPQRDRAAADLLDQPGLWPEQAGAAEARQREATRWPEQAGAAEARQREARQWPVQAGAEDYQRRLAQDSRSESETADYGYDEPPELRPGAQRGEEPGVALGDEIENEYDNIPTELSHLIANPIPEGSLKDNGGPPAGMYGDVGAVDAERAQGLESTRGVYGDIGFVVENRSEDAVLDPRNEDPNYFFPPQGQPSYRELELGPAGQRASSYEDLVLAPTPYEELELRPRRSSRESYHQPVGQYGDLRSSEVRRNAALVGEQRQHLATMATIGSQPHASLEDREVHAELGRRVRQIQREGNRVSDPERTERRRARRRR